MDSENVTTKMDDVELRLCHQTQLLYTIKTFFMS